MLFCTTKVLHGLPNNLLTPGAPFGGSKAWNSGRFHLFLAGITPKVDSNEYSAVLRWLFVSKPCGCSPWVEFFAGTRCNKLPIWAYDLAFLYPRCWIYLREIPKVCGRGATEVPWACARGQCRSLWMTDRWSSLSLDIWRLSELRSRRSRRDG